MIRLARAIRGLFPFTADGRQSLIYLLFALSGPALTVAVLWAMGELRDAGRWPSFERLALYILGPSLLISVCGLGMFVAIRSVKLGRDGFEAGGWRGPEGEQ